MPYPVAAYVTVTLVSTSLATSITTTVSTSLDTVTSENAVTSTTTAAEILGPMPYSVFSAYSDLAMIGGGALARAAAAVASAKIAHQGC